MASLPMRDRCATCGAAWRSCTMCAACRGMSLRIGVLGASRIAELAIVGPAQDLGHRLVAVAARDPERAQGFRRKARCRTCLGVLRRCDQRPRGRRRLQPAGERAARALEPGRRQRGQPVLTEKPFARNRAEAQQVAEAARRGNHCDGGLSLPVPPGDPSSVRARRRRHDGRHHHVEVRMAMPAPEAGDPRWSLELAGGALMDLGCYGLHVMRRLGHPSIVRAHAKERTAPASTHGATSSLLPPAGNGFERELDGRRRLPFHTTASSAPREMCWCTTSSSPTKTTGSRSARRRARQSSTWAPGRRTPTSWRRSPPMSCMRCTATAGHRRRGGEHGLCRRRVPGGRDGPALGAFVARGLRAAFMPP